MTYVFNRQKELRTDYLSDTAEVGNSMHLVPINGTNVLRRYKVGIK